MLIDASVALKWFLSEHDSETARQLIDTGSLEAPELILPEVGNGLWKAMRRGAIDRETYRQSLALIAEPFDILHPMTRLIESAGTIAMELDHPVYDCLYLAAATTFDEKLITADRRLLGKVAGTRFAHWCGSLDGAAA